ncbi:MAG: glucoamylase family protein, partial [Steroidobacteraceae bacterium]
MSDTLRFEDMSPARLATLSDDELLERVQRQTFRFFWEAAHPVSGLVPDRRPAGKWQSSDLVTTGGSGFALMALVVAVERGWISREQGLERAGAMLDVLIRATCSHGALPHFLDGRTGVTIPFSRKDDGGDLVETSFLCMALLTARQYFERDTPAETRVRNLMTWLWEEVEWDWYARAAQSVLYWHWSPNNGWTLEHEIRGWNECLITYVLAAGAPRYPISHHIYHRGFATGRDFINGRSWNGIELPLGPAFGGPLFFAHYSFCGLDPRGLED